MMTLQQRFHANAARMDQLAQAAPTDAEREMFRSFADNWRRLAEGPQAPPPESAPVEPAAPAPDRYLSYAQDMEQQARAAASPEERDLFRDFAARWRDLAEGGRRH
jgi:hypothetical protein